MIYQIHVTQDDIDNGIKADCKKCPGARAIERATGKECSVTTTDIMIVTKENRIRFITCPRILREFIGNFDKSYTQFIKPFSFEIDI